MRQHATLISGICAAMMSAIVTASILLFALPDAQDGAQPRQMAQDTIAASPLEALPNTSTESVGLAAESDPQANAEFVRPAVDWAAVYEQAAPSLVVVATTSGFGSGFFVTADGHLITNLHVVAGTEPITAILQDGSEHRAELIAQDAGNDLALLHIEPRGIEIILPTYGSMDELRVGDPVGALGSPYALPNSLTVGVISALGRTRVTGTATSEPLRSLIQTDASLNPGNSGGILVDAQGRVIGIPTQIESSDRGSSGVGFAVSADTMLRSLPTLLLGEDTQRSFLGVQVQEEGDDLVVIDVACQSTADRAGVREGDRIQLLDDRPANSMALLLQQLSEIPSGTEFALTILRGSRELQLDATAQAWPTLPPLYGCG